jgi:hypothetical protein
MCFCESHVGRWVIGWKSGNRRFDAVCRFDGRRLFFPKILFFDALAPKTYGLEKRNVKACLFFEAVRPFLQFRRASTTPATYLWNFRAHKAGL